MIQKFEEEISHQKTALYPKNMDSCRQLAAWSAFYLAILLVVMSVRESVGFVSIQPQRTTTTRENRLWSSSNDVSSSSSSSGTTMPESSSSSKSEGTPAFLLNNFLTSSRVSSAGTSTTTSTTAVSSLSSFMASNECDDVNLPPSLNILLRTLHQLTCASSSTDIRGRFVDHKLVGSVASVAHEIGRQPHNPHPSLTPFAAYCLGYGFARFVTEKQQQAGTMEQPQQQPITILVGQDPRPHGMRLADAFARGAEEFGRPQPRQQQQQQQYQPSQQLDDESKPSLLPSQVQVLYTGIATTPACAAFSGALAKAHASVMVTASHLPVDRNGLKLFLQGNCLNKDQIQILGHYASQCAMDRYTQHSLLPPSSGDNAVMCTSWVDYMPHYANSLKCAIQREVLGTTTLGAESDNDQDYNNNNQCLQGLTLVVNAGHGSGGFFQQVLEDLGANVVGSIGITPDAEFPLGIPNPEYKQMIEATIEACQTVQADLGIMLDTDSDRCGFVVPTTSSKAMADNDNDNVVQYEPLNRNRLIAMMGVILSQTVPGGRCGIVTDSVTSEGLSTFLQENLGLTHVRYLKGYQNVIDKAKELTETGVLNAELAMETSGHGAMKENNYLDDGTYTAVKVVSLLARQRQEEVAGDDDNNKKSSLLELIADMEEMDVIQELRFQVLDESLETMHQVFDFCALEIENLCQNHPNEAMIEEDVNVNEARAHSYWSVDMDNLEGIRVRVGLEGQFFMLRMSLHDPIISLQLEAASLDKARKLIVNPLLELFESEEQIYSQLNLSVLRDF